MMFPNVAVSPKPEKSSIFCDREYKPFVSSECDIKSLEIEGDEDFLILACDGLWDTLSPDAAVNLVYAYLTRNDGATAAWLSSHLASHTEKHVSECPWELYGWAGGAGRGGRSICPHSWVHPAAVQTLSTYAFSPRAPVGLRDPLMLCS
ncbi:Protein phosphatase 1E [Portunus trituberculatus]|uniref:Protein phosphatase 1E n=1 Tax=Portunus trituberculatus TaxID=210409 RepID=A0A5B7EY20_PORTR|nr:Protein phosphatase 1E [Portunus trituberculatus]